MRAFTTTISFLTIFAALISPAYAINIWEGAYCSSASAITTGGPTGPCNFCDALRVSANIVDYLLQFALIAATIMIVVGALTMMFAAGSEDRFATGKKTILNAVIGMAIALGSWLIVNTFIQFLAPGDASVPWDQINCISPS